MFVYYYYSLLLLFILYIYIYIYIYLSTPMYPFIALISKAHSARPQEGAPAFQALSMARALPDTPQKGEAHSKVP